MQSGARVSGIVVKSKTRKDSLSQISRLSISQQTPPGDSVPELSLSLFRMYATGPVPRILRGIGLPFQPPACAYWLGGDVGQSFFFFFNLSELQFPQLYNGSNDKSALL